jgi:DNA-binding NtrC family response regulator
MTKKSAKRLLIVDDDRFLCRTIAEGLADPGIEVTAVHSGREGRNFCAAQPVDLVLLDQKLPDANGIDCCAALLGLNERLKIIFITAYPSFENAVQAIKLGAHDYLSKPFELGELRLAVTNALRTIDLEQVEQVQLYKSRVESHDSSLIGARGALSEVWRLVQLAAHNPAPVLITGETGTGKSMVAKAIHYHGPDAAAPFLGINCAALPENLIEAELFGYEKGAFTGAAAAAKGIFELADQGTLFLDEIGEIPLHLQSKLLGVLDDHQIRRLGGQRFIPVRTRLIAATNADLAAAVR